MTEFYSILDNIKLVETVQYKLVEQSLDSSFGSTVEPRMKLKYISDNGTELTIEKRIPWYEHATIEETINLPVL